MGKQGEHGISWTNRTWNPIRGCSRVSEGCRHCYAEGVAYRFSGPGQAYEGLVTIGPNGERRRQWNGNVRFVEEHLMDPLKWKDAARVFVNSMSDLFHENCKDEWIDKIFAVMALCPQHTFQVLTKRPERMLSYMSNPATRSRVHFEAVATPRAHRVGSWTSAISLGGWPLRNVWLGVSTENQTAADERIPLLLQTPAAVHFISAEPLLGPLQLLWEHDGWDGADDPPLTGGIPWDHDLDNPHFVRHRTPRLDWVIVGGESGRGARPMHPDWVRELRDQCQQASVPFFFKQWGEWASVSETQGPGEHYHFVDGATVRRVGRELAGSFLDGRQWREFPEATCAAL